MAQIQSLLEQFPFDSTFTLKDGTDIKMPFHLTDGITAQVVGTIDTDAAEGFLNSAEFELVQLPGTENKGVGVLILQHILESPAGPYDEVCFCFLVKRKSAPVLNIPPIENPDDAEAVLNAVTRAIGAGNDGNRSQKEAGKPGDYGMYFQSLELDNQVAVDAGIEIWGYPKILSRVDYDISDQTFAVTVQDQNHDRTVFSLSYGREDFIPVDILGDSEVVLPDDMIPERNILSQAAGASGVHPGTKGRVIGFTGTFETGTSNSACTRALQQTRYQPFAVMELTKLQMVGFDSYKK